MVGIGDLHCCAFSTFTWMLEFGILRQGGSVHNISVAVSSNYVRITNVFWRKREALQLHLVVASGWLAGQLLLNATNMQVRIQPPAFSVAKMEQHGR
jgi:hypothetical protein